MKYRKKPVVIEAFQMTEERRFNNIDWPQWLHKAWNEIEFSEGALSIDADDPTRTKLVIGTLEGVLRVNWNDYIIQGVKGELYACKPDIFEATYEKLEDTQTKEEERIMFSMKEKQFLSAEIEKLLLSLNHPEMPKEKPEFRIHIDGKEAWSWADIEPNHHFEEKAPGINPWNERPRI